MADSLHLGIAGFVFVMLLIGIILTVMEFRRVIRDSEDRADGDPAESRHGKVKEGQRR